MKVILGVFHHSDVNRKNNKSPTSSKISNTAIPSILDSYKLIFPTKGRVIKENTISGRANYNKSHGFQNGSQII